MRDESLGPGKFCVDVGRFVGGVEEFVVCPDPDYQHAWLRQDQWALQATGGLVNTITLLFGHLSKRNHFSAVRVTTPLGLTRILPLRKARTTRPGDQMAIAAGDLCFQIFHEKEP